MRDPLAGCFLTQRIAAIQRGSAVSVSLNAFISQGLGVASDSELNQLSSTVYLCTYFNVEHVCFFLYKNIFHR